MSHTILYFFLLMSNMTDYIFIQFQIRQIISLFMNIGNFYSIFVIWGICISFHGTMLLSKNLKFIINKVFSYIVFVSVILMMIGCLLGSENQNKLKKGAGKSWRNDEMFNFDRGRVLQSLVLLVAAFRSNDEILQLFQQTGKKKVEEMQRYSIANVILFTTVSMFFGILLYFSNYGEFRNSEINLNKGFTGYYDNSIFINCVICTFLLENQLFAYKNFFLLINLFSLWYV